MLLETKGQMVVKEREPTLARWLKYAFLVCVSARMQYFIIHPSEVILIGVMFTQHQSKLRPAVVCVCFSPQFVSPKSSAAGLKEQFIKKHSVPLKVIKNLQEIGS